MSKKIRTIAIFFFFQGIIISQLMATSITNYRIKVKINGTSDSLCLLAMYYGDKQYIKDTAYLDKSGYYIFEGKDSLEGGIYIVAGQKKIPYFEFIVNSDNKMTFESDTVDITGKMKISGSEENTIFFDYMRFLASQQKAIQPLLDDYKTAEKQKDKDRIQAEINKINDNVKVYQKQLIETHSNLFVAKFIKSTLQIDVPEPDAKLSETDKQKARYYYYKKHYWDNIDLTDDNILRTAVFHNKLNEYFTKVLLQVPDTIIKEADSLIEIAKPNKEMFKYLVWYITTTSETSKIMGFDKIFVSMVEKYYMTNQAYWVTPEILQKITDRAKTLKPLLIGEKAPNMAMVDTSYRRVSIYDVQAEYLIVLFYDPDCGHCKKEIAALKPFYEAYKNKGVEVFAIFTEADVDYWKKFVKEQQMHWLNLINGYNIDYHKLYDIISTPAIYLLDKDKKIVAKRLSAEQTIELIKRLKGETIEEKKD